MSNAIEFDGGLTGAMQCTDLDRAIGWYENKLGFAVLFRVDEIGYCELSTPVERASIGLSVVDEPEVEGGTTLTFGVRDIAAARAALEAKGVAFDGETLTFPGMVSLATFYDADGNKLMFYQDLSEQG